MSAGWFEPYDSWFGDFNSLRQELDRLFDIGVPLSNIRSVPRGTFPAINMYETKDGVNVQALIPGVDPQKVQLNFENNTLTIKGERSTEQAEGARNCPGAVSPQGALQRILCAGCEPA